MVDIIITLCESVITLSLMKRSRASNKIVKVVFSFLTLQTPYRVSCCFSALAILVIR